MKYILLFIIVFISMSNVYGQSITWQRTYEFPQDRFGHAAIELFNGNYLVVGDQFPTNGIQIYLINKYGEIKQTYHYAINRIVRSINQLNDSSFILVGDESIFRLTKTLDSVWYKQIGNVWFSKIIPSTDGNFLTCGFIETVYSMGIN